ncbi:testican-3 isoform 1 [Cricetulus griseus]|nr:testican-3 isoform 1 [Cricetulus griseus]
MPAIAVLAAAAAAWCFLQVDSRHLDALAGGAALNNANFLDNDQWLSTVSQYDRDKYWNRFRDTTLLALSSEIRVLGLKGRMERDEMYPEPLNGHLFSINVSFRTLHRMLGE